MYTILKPFRHNGIWYTSGTITLSVKEALFLELNGKIKLTEIKEDSE